MSVVRFLSLLLALALTGPSVGSLVCDFACAAKHQQVPAVAGGCHDQGTAASTPAFAASHKCHDLVAATASVLPGTLQVDLIALTSSAEFPVVTAHGSATAHVVARPPGASHAPPLTPLRI